MSPEPDTRAQSDEGEALDARLMHCLDEMAEGSEGALHEFYDATLAKVYGVAIRILGDSALAEDVVTDVYHDVWSHAGAYSRDRGRPIGWLLTICRNRALDRYRRESSAHRTLEAAATEPAFDSVAKPDSLLEAVEEGHVVHALLASVSNEDRQLIALAFFRGYTHEQIASVTSMPLGTVKSRIRRVLKSLRKSAPADLQAGRG